MFWGALLLCHIGIKGGGIVISRQCALPYGCFGGLAGAGVG